MIEVASQASASSSSRSVAPFIAADVGGTYARVGLVRAELSASGATSNIALSEYRKYACADYPNLGEILRDFLRLYGDGFVERAVIACAGYVLDDLVINTNLPWQVSIGAMRKQLGLRDLALVNDFTAVAHATPYVNNSDMSLLTAAGVQAIGGPTLIVGPGTGLGAAVRIPGPQRATVLSTEAGQASLAPGTAIEIDVLRMLNRRAPHVNIESVLSGPGLVNLHHALCALLGNSVEYSVPAQIVEAALIRQEPGARQSLEVFCGWMGSVIGDLVLLYGAQGGVYLAGGILPQFKDFLLRSNFVGRFINKGAMREVMERVPVWLIEHGQLGVIGAAGWYLERQRSD